MASAWAADPDPQVELEQGCAAGDAGQCVRAALLRVDLGGSVEDARADLMEQCRRGSDEGCSGEDLLAQGAPGRPFAARTAQTAHLDPKLVFSRCYLPRVGRGGDPWGDLRAVVQYGPAGGFEGLSAAGRYVDDALVDCLTDEARLVAPEATPNGMRVTYVWPFDHGVRAMRAEPGGEFAEVAVRPTPALEACFDGVDVERVTLEVRERTGGAVGRVRWRERTGSGDADACVEDFLRTHGVPGGPGRSTLALWPHQWSPPVPRSPAAHAVGPPQSSSPPVLHFSMSSLLRWTPAGSCTADATVEADGYASRVDLRECDEDLADPVEASLLSWQWAVTEPSVTTVTFEADGSRVRVLAGERVVLVMEKTPSSSPSGGSSRP